LRDAENAVRVKDTYRAPTGASLRGFRYRPEGRKSKAPRGDVTHPHVLASVRTISPSFRISMEKYYFGDIIGHGNYGTCHIVTHKKENRHYVAKRIPVHDVAARGEALAEAQLLSKIKHPNVIAYKESFLSSPDDDDDNDVDDVDVKRDGNRKSANRRRRFRGGDCLCIVTAYAEEGDLFTHIKRARESNPRRYFPERQVLDWTAQIALALDHIHAMRVMHRDLKTQNIFLGRGGVVKLGDFGISRVLERTDDFATTVAGTPYYLSPEVCQNQPYTLKSDVWSFGCVAYEIATLEHAFAADSLLSLVYQIVNGTCDYKEISERYDERFVGLIQAMLRRDSAKRPSVASVLRSEIMQDHLRRMQRDGLGRPRSAIVAPPPRPLIVPRDRVTSSHGNQKKGGAHQTDGSTSYATPTTTSSVASNAQGKVKMTPKEAMAERRRKAAEAREAVLLAAATEQSNVAKEAFRREFHAPGSVTCSDVSSATSADEARDGNNAGSGSIPAGNGDESRDFARRAYEEKRGDEEKVAFDSRGEATEADAGGSGSRGWEDEVAEYALQETGGSFGLRSLGLGEVVDSLEGLNVGDEGDSRNEVELGPEAEPFAHTSGFVPPAADASVIASSSREGFDDAKEDTFAGGFASGASEEMCFSPPPGAAVRVPDASQVLFRGETRSRYDDVSDSDAGSLPLDGRWDGASMSIGGTDQVGRDGSDPAFPATVPLTNDPRDDEGRERVGAFSLSDGGEEPVPDASWLNSTLPNAPLSPAQTDMEMDVLAALTLDAEADVRAEEEVSLVTAFAARHMSSGDGGSESSNGVFAPEPFRDARKDVPVDAYDHDDAPRIERDAESERAVLLEAAKSLDKEDAEAVRAAANGENGESRNRKDASASPRDASFSEPPLPTPPADDSVVAARAHKVSRLRAMCGAQLGDAFEDVHAFLRSARRRRADDAEVKTRLMALVKNDGAKLAACFAVDMLCFEEEHLFSELEQVRAPGTYAPGVNVFVDDSGRSRHDAGKNGAKNDALSDVTPSGTTRSARSSTASSRSQSPRMSSPHTALPGGGLDRRAFKATAAEREKARKRISLPGA